MRLLLRASVTAMYTSHATLGSVPASVIRTPPYAASQVTNQNAGGAIEAVSIRDAASEQELGQMTNSELNCGR